MFNKAIVAAALAPLLVTVAYAHTEDHNPVRAHYVDEQGLPEAYQGLENPLEPSEANIAAGGELYAQNCATCHGAKGGAQTPVAQTLDPSPPSLTMISMAEDEPTMEGGRMEEMRALEDGYLFWVIEKGGRPTGSAMPATEETLSDEERWQIIHHLRHGLDTPI